MPARPAIINSRVGAVPSSWHGLVKSERRNRDDVGIAQRIAGGVLQYHELAQQAKKFYGETLGLPVAAFMGDEVGWMEFGEKDGNAFWPSTCGAAPSRSARNGGATVVFSVDDAYKTIAECCASGRHSAMT